MLSYALPLSPLAIGLCDQTNKALALMAERLVFQSLLGPTSREHQFYQPEVFGAAGSMSNTDIPDAPVQGGDE